MKKYQAWIGTAAVIVVAAALFMIWRSQPVDDKSKSDIPALENKQPSARPRDSAKSNRLAGRLMDSDNVERGNLMLVMADRVVYLNTLRDFQKFVGKPVVVSIDGTVDNFRLIDIAAK